MGWLNKRSLLQKLKSHITVLDCKCSLVLVGAVLTKFEFHYIYILSWITSKTLSQSTRIFWNIASEIFLFNDGRYSIE